VSLTGTTFQPFKGRGFVSGKRPKTE
jgi:hypothetical protein